MSVQWATPQNISKELHSLAILKDIFIDISENNVQTCHKLVYKTNKKYKCLYHEIKIQNKLF